MKTGFNVDVHYGLAEELNNMYDEYILNDFTPDQAMANAMAQLQNRISILSRHWEDAKINEQIQREPIAAATAPCVLPPYSVIQQANRKAGKSYPANMPVSDDPTFIFRH